jgi:hypothetical protein
MNNLLKVEGYNPVALFESVMDKMHIRNDASLARTLGVGSPTICKMRKKAMPITSSMLIRMHDVTGQTIDELRDIAHIPKTTAKAPTAQQGA